MITQGDKDHPVQLNDHLWGDKITEVHWNPGGIVTVEVTFVPGLANILSFNPFEQPPNTDFNAGDTVGPDKYNNEYIIFPENIAVDAGPWLAENEIFPVVSDFHIVIPGPDSADWVPEDKSNAIAVGNSAAGYPGPTVDLIGAVPVFPTLIETNPDGHKIQYFGQGYAAKNPWWFFTDNYGNPDPFHATDNFMYDYAALDSEGINDHSEVLVWFRVLTRPPVYYEKSKMIWLFNCTSSKVIVGRIIGSPGAPCDFTLRGYNVGTQFTFNADATITAKNANGTPATAKWAASGSASDGAPHDFNGQGLITA